jgi:CDP-glycerol glycerophosphotransferase (TagB/SpsB family)
VTDEIPQYSPTKGDVKTVFISHGITGDKLYGLDCSESHRAGAEQVDFAVCCNSFYAGMRTASQLALSADRVLRLGLPVTDWYFGKSKGDGCTVLAKHGRSYLYAPTWRARGNPPLPAIDWRKLDLMMEPDEMIVVKRHMCTAKPIVGESLHHVIEADSMEPSMPYVVDCDVLATDFSSVLFDGYIAGKPSVLVTDGYRDYCRVHGMYEAYPDFYGSRAVEAEGNEEGFLAALRDAAETGIGAAELRCIDLVAGFGNRIDGHASERVAALVAKLAEGE